MNWNWDFAWECLPQILRGLGVTLTAVAGGTVIAIVLGLVWTLLRRSSLRIISWPAAFVVEFIRSTPLLVQLFFFYFVLPEIGLVLKPLSIGIFGLGLHYSCYMSEVYRAGIDAVPRGQWEASTALSFTRAQIYRRIILPQAIPPIIPALGNYVIAMFKDAPLLMTITVLGMLYQAQDIANRTARYLEPLTIVGVIFLVLSLIAGLGIRILQRKWKVVHA